MKNESFGSNELCVSGAGEKKPVEMTNQPVEMANQPVGMTNLPVRMKN